ncbi:MAG: tetratricopeptide repeat protein [Bryobacteraceae bacterium]
MVYKSVASSLLKGLALTIGGGVALGVGIKIGQGGFVQEPVDSESDDGSALDPVLDRLEGIESRIGHVESALAEGPGAAHSFHDAGGGEPLHNALGQFESRFSSQDSEMAALRGDLREFDERNSGRLIQFGDAMTQLQSSLPVLVEETVGTCFEQMEKKLQREIEETHARTLDTFVENIQTRVIQRISVFERDLEGQAEAMTQLREYSLKTDQNMQRLLVGVDRLASEIARKAELKGPDLKAPDLKVPDLKVPDLKVPDLKALDLKADLKVPDLKVPEPKVPEPALSESQPPVLNAPERQSPDLRVPDLKTPDLRVPDLKAELKAPDLKAAEPKVPEPKVPEPSLSESHSPVWKVQEPALPEPQRTVTKAPETPAAEPRPAEPLPPEPKAREPKKSRSKDTELKSADLKQAEAIVHPPALEEPDDFLEPASNPPQDPFAQDLPAQGTPGFIPNPLLDQPSAEVKPRAKWLVPTVLTGAAATIGLLGWQSGIMSSPQAGPPAHTAQSNLNQSGSNTSVPKSVPSAEPAPPARTPAASLTETSPIDSARAYLQRHEYAKAEEIYRTILKTDPRNREVVLALADVLYRQNKFEESANVLKALSAPPRP